MILGAVSVLFAPVWLALLMPVLSEARLEAARASCGDNIRQILLAARAYRSQFGRPPSSIGELRGAGLLSPDALCCPLAGGGNYAILPLDPAQAPPDALLVYEKDPSVHRGGAPCGLADGSVAVLWPGDIPLHLARAEQLLRSKPP